MAGSFDFRRPEIFVPLSLCCQTWKLTSLLLSGKRKHFTLVQGDGCATVASHFYVMQYLRLCGNIPLLPDALKAKSLIMQRDKFVFVVPFEAYFPYSLVNPAEKQIPMDYVSA